MKSLVRQLEARNTEGDGLTLKTEKLINSKLHELMEQGKISEKIYQRLGTNGSQPARLFGLLKYIKTVRRFGQFS